MFGENATTITGEKSALERLWSGYRAAPPVVDDDERRLRGLELLIVLSIFPLGSALLALLHLSAHLQSGEPIALDSNLWELRGSALPLLYGILFMLSSLGVVLLILYLLARSADGPSAINLDRTNWRLDLALLLPSMVLVQLIPQWLGRSIMSWTNVHPFPVMSIPVGMSRPVGFLFAVAYSFQAGIVEEVVVLGYLVRRLEERAIPISAIVIISVLVRVSYHLYYGPGVIPIVLWALVTVLLYMRIRRLLPFIVCHVAYDIGVNWRFLYDRSYLLAVLAALLCGVAFTLRWGRWRPPLDNSQVPDERWAQASRDAWKLRTGAIHGWQFWSGALLFMAAGGLVIGRYVIPDNSSLGLASQKLQSFERGIIPALAPSPSSASSAAPNPLKIAGVPGYSTYAGPSGQPLQQGRPWGQPCQPVAIVVGKDMPAALLAPIQQAIDEARSKGVDVTIGREGVATDLEALYPSGQSNASVQFVYIVPNSKTPQQLPDGLSERIKMSWDAKPTPDGTHEYLTDIQGDVFLKAVGNDPLGVEEVTRELIAFTQGVETSTAPNSAIGNGSDPDHATAFSQSDLSAMQVMAGCQFQPTNGTPSPTLP